MAREMNRLANVLNIIDQPIYDRQLIAATSTELMFFQTPISSTVTKVVTNMTQVGRLPSPQSFECRALRFAIAATNVLADVKLILDGSFIEFEVADKLILTLPTITIPSGCGIAGATTLTNTNGIADIRNAYTFRNPIYIGKDEQFKVTLKIPTALAALSASTNAWCFLDGFLTRGVN